MPKQTQAVSESISNKWRNNILNGKRNKKKSFTYYIWHCIILSAHAFFSRHKTDSKGNYSNSSYYSRIDSCFHIKCTNENV